MPAHASSPVAVHDGTILARGFGGGFGRSRGFGRSPGFGSRGFGRRPYARRHGILRRIVRALAIGYLLHLLFTTPGGLIVLVFLILLVVFALRRRPRRFSY